MMRAERFTVLVVNDESLLHRILNLSLDGSGRVAPLLDKCDVGV
jgi:hypothetical protein